MKNYLFKISLFVIFLFALSCNDNNQFTIEIPKKIALNETFKGVLKEKNISIDSVQFLLNGKKIPSKGTEFTINTAEIGVGKHLISALIFYPGKTKKQNIFFEVVANKAPEIYTFKIINSYPHDPKAYTQGLEYYNGFLYESTGRRGQSSLRKVELETGKVLQKVDLKDTYFGEGMTIFNNKIIWLTWKGKKGFVYDLNTFKKEKEFQYNKSTRGWGLTHSETALIKSDGSHKIWFLDPKSLKEKRFIQVYTNKYAIDYLNELEFMNGKLYANKYLKDVIIIIDIKTGVVSGVADLSGLKKEMEKSQKLVPNDEVLNGIAYDSSNNRLFVTGKHWGKLFEIALVKKQ